MKTSMLIEGIVVEEAQVIDSMSAVEKEMLMSKVADVKAHLQPGFGIVIWSSLTIKDFVLQAEKVHARLPRYCISPI